MSKLFYVLDNHTGQRASNLYTSPSPAKQWISRRRILQDGRYKVVESELSAPVPIADVTVNLTEHYTPYAGHHRKARDYVDIVTDTGTLRIGRYGQVIYT